MFNGQLHDQVRFGHRECVELLLAVPGVDLEARDAMGRGLTEIARWNRL